MAKLAILILFALATVTLAKPFGGIGVAHKTAHVSHSSVISPFLGMGMMYPGLGMMGGYGMGGMMGMKGLMMGYPGMMGYGMMG